VDMQWFQRVALIRVKEEPKAFISQDDRHKISLHHADCQVQGFPLTAGRRLVKYRTCSAVRTVRLDRREDPRLSLFIAATETPRDPVRHTRRGRLLSARKTPLPVRRPAV
jgi:hypothetical protein